MSCLLHNGAAAAAKSQVFYSFRHSRYTIGANTITYRGRAKGKRRYSAWLPASSVLVLSSRAVSYTHLRAHETEADL
eukprot:642437-Amphidinium_carterae.1